MEHPRVIFVASELNPIAKVGGLADVVGALPKALTNFGVHVAVVLPFYDAIDRKRFSIQPTATEFPVTFGSVQETVHVYRTTIPATRIPVILLENPRFFSGKTIYGSDSAFAETFQEIQRFIFFSFAAAEYIQRLPQAPHIVHAHDWHAGLVSSILKTHGLSIPTILTIHNLGNPGKWNEQEVRNFAGTHLDLTDDDATDGSINLLAHGIRSADWVTTVSPTYAKEILTPEYGEGMEMFLRTRKDRLVGILNGIDTELFSPKTDSQIAATYSSDSVERKEINKRALQRECTLPESNALLCGIVSRLTADQKGIDLVIAAIPELLKFNLQLVILGTGKKKLEQALKAAAKKYPNLVAKLTFDSALAQRIYAGCDTFLMPSRFEPCGLGQQIALRYGTLPIVRDTGGLHDTVRSHTRRDGTGFLFPDCTSVSLTHAVRIAHDLYHSNKPRWKTMMRNAMAQDVSWNKSAAEYLHLYQRAMVS